MYCNRCGIKINDDDKYCFSCGAELKNNITTSNIDDTLKTENTKPRVFDTFAIVSLFIGIFTLSFILSKHIGIEIIGILITSDYFLLLPINGVIAAILGLKATNNKAKAIVGLVLSSVATLLAIIDFILFLI